MLPILNATGPCMKGSPPDLKLLFDKAEAKATSAEIDPTQDLRRQKVYLFHGYNDAVVAKSVTDAAADFYRHYLSDANRGNLYYQTAVGAGHSLVILRGPQGDGLNGCKDNEGPYIDQCDYDQAGMILQHIYGALNQPNRGPLTGTIKRFDQSLYSKPEDTSPLSLGDTGYVFVPKDCGRSGATRPRSLSIARTLRPLPSTRSRARARAELDRPTAIRHATIAPRGCHKVHPARGYPLP